MMGFPFPVKRHMQVARALNLNLGTRMRKKVPYLYCGQSLEKRPPV